MPICYTCYLLETGLLIYFLPRIIVTFIVKKFIIISPLGHTHFTYILLLEFIRISNLISAISSNFLSYITLYNSEPLINYINFRRDVNVDNTMIRKYQFVNNLSKFPGIDVLPK